MLKYYIKVIVRNILKIFWLLPIDSKKIYFRSYKGSNMSCNPLYIFMYMHEKYHDYKYIWYLNHELDNQFTNTRFVKKNTFLWIKEVLTSKFLIVNDFLYAYLPYRKEQIIIETWHGGGAYKKVDSVALFNRNEREQHFRIIQYLNKYLTAFISSNLKFTSVMCETLGQKKEIFLSIGMPRNDIFFNEHTIRQFKAKICSKYALNENNLIILYAPTYRGKVNSVSFKNNLDISLIKHQFEVKYGKQVTLIFRGHYSIKNISVSCYDQDVSEHPDMQELLCAADILITDYSSAMWDYSFLYRPCFLFVPDLDEYMENRGFYTDPYSWGFPICKTNQDLVNSISQFDEQLFVEAMKKHHKDLGSYENGTATQKIVDFIINTK